MIGKKYSSRKRSTAPVPGDIQFLHNIFLTYPAWPAPSLGIRHPQSRRPGNAPASPPHLLQLWERTLPHWNFRKNPARLLSRLREEWVQFDAEFGEEKALHRKRVNKLLLFIHPAYPACSETRKLSKEVRTLLLQGPLTPPRPPKSFWGVQW